MKKSIFVFSLMLIVCLTFVSSNSYGIGIPKVSNKVSSSDSSSANVKQKVDNMFVLSETATQTYNDSIMNLNQILLSKEEISKLKEKQKSLTGSVNVSEKNAIAGEVISDAENNLISMTDDKNLTDKINNLSSDQKELLGSCASNVILSNLSFAALASESSSLVKEVSSNPKAAIGIDVAKLKSIAEKAPKQVSSSAKVSSSIIKLLKSNKIEFKQPTSATDKPEEIKNFSFDEE